MKSIRDLEQHIHKLWGIKDQVDTLMWRYLDHPEPMTEDEMANQLMAIAYTLDMYCEKLFDEFKKIAQLDEYAPDDIKAMRAELLKKLSKKKKKKFDDDRC